jgi:hypothetical protein
MFLVGEGEFFAIELKDRCFFMIALVPLGNWQY